jgi:hypothetical protein
MENALASGNLFGWLIDMLDLRRRGLKRVR